jgi:hypothetical protein
VVTALLAATAPAARAQDDGPPPAVDATVVGIVVDGSGRPIADLPVVVTVGDTGLAAAFGPAFGLFTLGLGCLTGICTSKSDTVDRTTTAADGSYSATLPRAYVAGRETDDDWFVRASLPASGDQRSGASSAFEFETNIKVQEAPPLPVWGAAPTVSVDGWGVTVDVGPAPAGLGGVKVAMGSPSETLTASGTKATFDARLLESESSTGTELAVNGSGSADVRVNHANGRTIYHQRTTTAVLPVELVTVPVSRGATCSAKAADEREVLPASTAAHPCPLTDGNFLTRVSGNLPAPAGGDTTTTSLPPTITEATLDLLAPVDASLIVLRGMAPGPVVDLSVDGASWSTVRTAAPPNVGASMSVAVPPAGTQARYVRVRSPQGADPGEVSVWTPRPLDLPAPLAGATVEAGPTSIPAGVAQPSATMPGSSDDDHDGAKQLAILGVILGWGAIAYVRKQRRTP